MANKLSEAIKKELHPDAKELIHQHISNFATSLILEAKVRAFQKNAEVVLSNDVLEAIDVINRKRTQNWGKQLNIVIGSAFIGAFVPGFATEFSSNELDAMMILLYTVFGFFGLFLVFRGLNQ